MLQSRLSRASAAPAGALVPGERAILSVLRLWPRDATLVGCRLIESFDSEA